ncbi:MULTISPECIES: MarR family winged helix-turn-helix transcriptional regulator [Anaerotignum]|uniref:MarR family winged helix-turn-helix transcriptional regulator n=1 Tax=Anaerotignum TaxID=2039240 RepID=UPI00210CB116|nr:MULTISPECIES: MarR family transcriptional regulator [Anaerotignum]MCQ4936151.1 MarR family transcriptional regulator [Anaerotignum propionicum]
MAKAELKILIGLHRAVNYIDRQSAKIFTEYKLSMGQFAVLEALYHKGDATVGEIQERILSSSGTMPLIINNLEKRGYLIRKTDSKDKRRCILHITPQGEEIIGEVYPRNEAKIIELMSYWTEEEKEQMVTLLKKFGDEINGEKS